MQVPQDFTGDLYWRRRLLMRSVLRAGAAGLLHRRPGADGDDRQCVAGVLLLRAHAKHAALCRPRQRCLRHHHMPGRTSTCLYFQPWCLLRRARAHAGIFVAAQVAKACGSSWGRMLAKLMCAPELAEGNVCMQSCARTRLPAFRAPGLRPHALRRRPRVRCCLPRRAPRHPLPPAPGMPPWHTQLLQTGMPFLPRSSWGKDCEVAARSPPLELPGLAKTL